MRERKTDTFGSLDWNITWCRAFPTLAATRLYLQDEDSCSAVWQLLAFQTIFGLSHDEEWKYTRDEAGMAESLGYGEITTKAVFQILDRVVL
jgi:hypothetical protein